MDSVNSVLIVGGTHGNETSGLAILHDDTQNQLRSSVQTLTVNFAAGNPNAIDGNVRFTEEDLNRQFTVDNLQGQGGSYEAQRARELNQQWGPKGASATDLVIDIHNTTANMGATLIVLIRDDFHIGLARYVKQHMPEANILVEDEQSPLSHPYLCTIGQRGVMVEVGAQPQGVYRADITELAIRLTQCILDYCVWFNQDANHIDMLTPAEGFRLGDIVHYPQADGRQARKWMIHPDVQDRDFALLQRDEPVFISFQGEVVKWDGADTYPHFINEAAYYKLSIAFATASKVVI